MTAAMVQLLGPAYAASDTDATVFHVVLVEILALQIFLSSIVSTTGRGELDSPT